MIKRSTTIKFTTSLSMDTQESGGALICTYHTTSGTKKLDRLLIRKRSNGMFDIISFSATTHCFHTLNGRTDLVKRFLYKMALKTARVGLESTQEAFDQLKSRFIKLSSIVTGDSRLAAMSFDAAVIGTTYPLLRELLASENCPENILPISNIFTAYLRKNNWNEVAHAIIGTGKEKKRAFFNSLVNLETNSLDFRPATWAYLTYLTKGCVPAVQIKILENRMSLGIGHVPFSNKTLKHARAFIKALASPSLVIKYVTQAQLSPRSRVFFADSVFGWASLKQEDKDKISLEKSSIQELSMIIKTAVEQTQANIAANSSIDRLLQDSRRLTTADKFAFLENENWGEYVARIPKTVAELAAIGISMNNCLTETADNYLLTKGAVIALESNQTLKIAIEIQENGLITQVRGIANKEVDTDTLHFIETAIIAFCQLPH